MGYSKLNNHHFHKMLRKTIYKNIFKKPSLLYFILNKRQFVNLGIKLSSTQKIDITQLKSILLSNNFWILSNIMYYENIFPKKILNLSDLSTQSFKRNFYIKSSKNLILKYVELSFEDLLNNNLKYVLLLSSKIKLLICNITYKYLHSYQTYEIILDLKYKLPKKINYYEIVFDEKERTILLREKKIKELLENNNYEK